MWFSVFILSVLWESEEKQSLDSRPEGLLEETLIPADLLVMKCNLCFTEGIFPPHHLQLETFLQLLEPPKRIINLPHLAVGLMCRWTEWQFFQEEVIPIGVTADFCSTSCSCGCRNSVICKYTKIHETSSVCRYSCDSCGLVILGSFQYDQPSLEKVTGTAIRSMWRQLSVFFCVSDLQLCFNFDTKNFKIFSGSKENQFGYTVQQHEAGGRQWWESVHYSSTRPRNQSVWICLHL